MGVNKYVPEPEASVVAPVVFVSVNGRLIPRSKIMPLVTAHRAGATIDVIAARLGLSSDHVQAMIAAAVHDFEPTPQQNDCMAHLRDLKSAYPDGIPGEMNILPSPGIRSNVVRLPIFTVTGSPGDMCVWADV